MNKHYIIPVFVSHKGCPHDCVFCNQKRITGVNDDITKEDVLNIINSYLATIEKDNSYIELSFYGGSFTGIEINKQNELLSAAKQALDEGRIDNIRLSTRPDYIDNEILENLKSYGVGVIELGVQSMDEEVLILSGRGHTRQDVINASNLIKEYNFKLGLQMMVGLPGDNIKKDISTANEIVSLKPDFVRIYPALTIKDTYMEFMYSKGEYTPLTIDEAIEICKELYLIFIDNRIQIIRIGLQPTEQINLGKDVIAGPFHPSFRELVESKILNDMLDLGINKYFSNFESIEIGISPRYISKLYADRKKFFNNIIKKNTTKKLFIRQDASVEAMSLLLFNENIERNMSIFDYIHFTKKEGFSS